MTKGEAKVILMVGDDMTKRIDITGQKFGKLTVIRYDHTRKPRGTVFWACKCECGNDTIVASGHLRNGHTQSCGCLQIEVIKERSDGNTWGRKYENPKMASARTVWQCAYADGCSLETFMELSQKPCAYCTEKPSNCFNKYLAKDGHLTNDKVSQEWAEQAYFTYNGLDRVDPAKNHSDDNVVPCCIKCNRAKRDMTLDEFTEWLTRLAANFLHTK